MFCLLRRKREEEVEAGDDPEAGAGSGLRESFYCGLDPADPGLPPGNCISSSSPAGLAKFRS